MDERILDATFGLATFTDRTAQLPDWAYDLHRDRLEKLLLHPKYGLYSDPKREDDIALAFPIHGVRGKGMERGVSRSTTASLLRRCVLSRHARRIGADAWASWETKDLPNEDKP